MLTLRDIDNFNPFEWDALRCPLCKGNEFTSINHAAVYCECCARFSVRDTAGDPGCVIDCYVTREHGGFVYAPAYNCPKCDGSPDHGRFDHEDKTCPLNMNHQMVRQPRRQVPWTAPRGMVRLCLILKLGDYVSGWMSEGRERIPGPTQEEWDAYQQTLHISNVQERFMRGVRKHGWTLGQLRCDDAPPSAELLEFMSYIGDDYESLVLQLQAC